MNERTFPAVVAVLFAVILAFLLFVPFVAIQYRRRGRLGLGPSVLAFLSLVYLLALLTYTLLPLPVITADFCRVRDLAPQLVPGRFVADIVRESRAADSLVRNPALLQVVFNIALFVPLGMLLRFVFRRPIVTTALIGACASLFIEVTQLTGDWFLFPCSYRLFDVDDLIANTAGAAAGSLLAPILGLIPWRLDRATVSDRPVTPWRRLLGMACDWGFVTGTGLALSAGVLLCIAAIEGRTTVSMPDGIQALLTWVVPAAIQLLLVVTRGRTVGELVVRIRPVGEVTPARGTARWLIGIGGFSLLSAVPVAGAGLVITALVVASVIAAFRTSGHRGLAYAAVDWGVASEAARRADDARAT